MRRKSILLLVAVLLLLVIGAAWRFAGPNTSFKEPSKFLYIRSSDAPYQQLLKSLRENEFIKNPGSFDWFARKRGLDIRVKPGKYEVVKGMSIFDIVRMLRNGRQSPVNLVITKIRTKQDLASLVARKFECDSISIIQWLGNNDSLRTYHLDTNTAITGIYPNTYTFFWSATPSLIFRKLFAEKQKIWSDSRIALASAKKITPDQAYIIASIVEEETNADDEKGNIASVYLNRYQAGMKLQADPTVKYALNDFGLRRIYEKHLTINSPYNTYRYPGLPPGPICTPQLKTIDAVLNAPDTRFMYFVADSNFSGRHIFSESYDQHLKHARAFQEALNKQQQKNKPAGDEIN